MIQTKDANRKTFYSGSLSLEQIHRIDIHGQEHFVGEFQSLGQFGKYCADATHVSGADHDLESKLFFGAGQGRRGGAHDHDVVDVRERLFGLCFHLLGRKLDLVLISSA